MAFQRANSFQQEAIEIHPDLLYFWVTRRGESGRAATSSGLLLHIDNELTYEPFANDFGPLHLGCTYRFCRKLSFLLKESARQSKPVIFVTSSHPHRKGNATVLLGAWLILFEDYTGEAAYTALQRAEPFTPFRDASCGHSQFGLTVKQVLAGIYKAKQVGFIDWHLPQSTFNLKKYEFYEQVINGDWNWIIPNKFLAFSGPTCRSREQSVYGTLGCLDYVPLFHQEAITGIVRLNRPQYDKRDFTAAGFSHYDLYFPDGTTPPSSILQTFLSIAETEPGAIAVHCKAGLGRTGTLIGCYIMKHYGFTAAEVIAYIRLCRPGSILGPQQVYLHEQQARMWNVGNHQGQPTAAGVVQRNIPGTVPASLSAPARSRSVSSSQTRGSAAALQSSQQRLAAGAYTTKAPGSTGVTSAATSSASTAMSHPASMGFAALDSVPGSTAAQQLRRRGSMPARIGSSFGASGSRNQPSQMASRSDCTNIADSAEKELNSLKISQQQNSDASPADQGPQVVRKLASNGQPRKVLAGAGAPSAQAEGSIGTHPTCLVGMPRDLRRTASNGQPRKGLSFTRTTDGHGQLRNASFRNR